MPISLCFVYLDVKQPGNTQLAFGMAIIHHVVLHSLLSRDQSFFIWKSRNGVSRPLFFYRLWLKYMACHFNIHKVSQ